MDFNDTEKRLHFARTCAPSSKLTPSVAPAPSPRNAAVARDIEALGAAKAWQAKKAEAGFAAITWPKAVGGRGGTPIQQIIYSQEEAQYVTRPRSSPLASACASRR